MRATGTRVCINFRSGRSLSRLLPRRVVCMQPAYRSTMKRAKLVLAALCLSTTSAFAAGQVLLETPVTYAPDASVVDQIKNECHIEDMLTRHVGDALAGSTKRATAPSHRKPTRVMQRYLDCRSPMYWALAAAHGAVPRARRCRRI